MKKIICSLIAMLLLLSVVGCADSNQPTTDEKGSNDASVNSGTDTEGDAGGDASGGNNNGATDYPKKTYLLNSNTVGVKILGERRLDSEIQLNLDWTGSGLEMNITHGGGDIVFMGNTTDPAYFRAYIDGEEFLNGISPYFELDSVSRRITLKNVPAGDHNLKLIKVTGYTLARSELLSVSFSGVIKEERPADKELYIEFVGDSISCGWGTIGSKGGAYTDQDGTLAYPLKIADALNADYSVTALSGQGLIYGTKMSEGYLYGSIYRSKTQEYDFERKADIVIINIGTNDYYYRTDDKGNTVISDTEFKSAYLNFLRTVREKNGEDCKIICLYNTMNDTFASVLLEAVNEFAETDTGVVVMKTLRTDNNQHPDIAEHETLTNDILAFIDRISDESGDNENRVQLNIKEKPDEGEDRGFGAVIVG